MLQLINVLTGTHSFKVKPSDAIEDVKQYLENALGLPIEQQRLSYRDQELDNSAAIASNNIKEDTILKLDSSIAVLIPMAGKFTDYFSLKQANGVLLFLTFTF